MWVQTPGTWSWKSKSYNECVITHLPNPHALKIDDAKAKDLDFAEDHNDTGLRVRERDGAVEGVKA